MTAEAEAGHDAKGGGGKKKLILIGAAAAIVVLLGGGGFFVFQMMSAPATAESPAHGAADSHAAPAASDGHGGTAAASGTHIFDLPPITVNIDTASAQPAYLRMTVSLEVADEAMVGQIEPRMAHVLDAFQVYLRELRRSDLEGSAGIYRLREELMRRINIAIHPAQIDAILFKELLVQ